MRPRFPIFLVGVLTALCTIAHAAKDRSERPPAAPQPALGGTEQPGLFQEMLEGSLAGTQKIVFATRQPAREWHFFANTGYMCENPEREFFSAGGGGLYVLDLHSLETRTLLEDEGGAVRDPCLSYDAQKVLFSYRPANEKVFHLYEINIDGSGLTQLTDGLFDDIEPIYLPDGDIVFSSARARRYVPCMTSQVSLLYRCEPDGSNIRMLSNGQENELTPWMLPDGRVIYMRWEYVERDVRTFHHLWTFNPDGTSEMVYFGNNAESYVDVRGGPAITDAKPIPETDKVVATFGSHHGAKEYAGHIAIIDPAYGPEAWEKLTYLTDGKEEPWRDPYPITEDCFLVAAHNSLYVMDGTGNYEAFFTLPDGRNWVHEPRPLVPREKESIIPERTDYSKNTGQLILSSAHVGRNMEGVEPGDVKKLLVLEVLPKPISWGHPSKIEGAGHNVKRVLGTIPVEEDGSAYMELPALRALMFVMLDEHDRAIKRMRSFITLKPGEVNSCVGCHEQRTRTVHNTGRETLLALERGPSFLERPAALPPDGLLDYQRDVQPLLDQHCVSCHNYKREKSNIVLDGAVQPSNAQGYRSLQRMTSLGKGHGNDDPYTVGSGNSGLLKLLDEGHAEVNLSKNEKELLRLWIDAGQRYAATYGAMTPRQEESIGVSDSERDQKRNLTAMIDARIFTNRCDDCHGPSKNGARRYVRDSHFDLTRPERSLLLMAPLAQSAGGLGRCRPKETAEGDGTVFADTTDEDYQALLKEIRAAAEVLEADNRYWEPGFVGDPVYIREMIRYGVLPADFDPETPIDPFAVDASYYELFYPETDMGDRAEIGN